MKLLLASQKLHRAKGNTSVYTMRHLRDLLQKVIYVPSFEFNEGHNQSHRNGMVPHECTELCFYSRLYYVQGPAKLKG